MRRDGNPSITSLDEPPDDSLSDEPSGDGQVPVLSAFNNRRLQTTKVIDPPNPLNPTIRTYTITATNRSGSDMNLTKIHDRLPAGFTYIGPTNGVTINDPGLDLGINTWNLSPLGLPDIVPGASESLSFNVSVPAGLPDGNYCNEAWVEAGGTQTTSGATAPVVIVTPSNEICSAEPAAATVTKVVSSATYFEVIDDTPPSSTYSVVIGYTIGIKNIGTALLNMIRMCDYLPLGFCYIADSTTYEGNPYPNPELNIPAGSTLCPDDDTRQRVTWDVTEVIPSGSSRTVAFSTKATLKAGDYWSDLLVTFDEIPDDVYTWPTALVTIRDAFSAEAKIGDSSKKIGRFEVWVGSESGTLNKWTIK